MDPLGDPDDLLPADGPVDDVDGSAGASAGASGGVHPLLTYQFGTGDGPMHEWSSAADRDLDGDGRFDAVGIDFDGDGAVDDAMWDSDGDGRADLAAIDTGATDRPDAFYSDTGRGIWDHRVHDVAAQVGSGEPRGGPPAPHPAPAAAPRPPVVGDATPDSPPDRDGAAGDRVVDPDRSGRSTVGLVFAGSDGARPTRVFVDLDGDGRFDGVVTDDDSDGVADSWALRGQNGFDPAQADAVRNR